MSEKIENEGQHPRTRREVLEGHKYEKGFWGPEVHATSEEPLPDEEHSGYHDVQVRSDRIELKHGGLLASATYMTLLSLITFFIPLFNGLLGGFFGGFRAHRWGRAFGAAAVASVLVPGLFAFFYGFFDTPDTLYLFYGLGFWGWTALHVVGLFIGAAAGVYSRPLADRRRPRQVTGG
jgi:hypothetical protein